MIDWKGKYVLVTGGTGFIGSLLVEALLDRGASVRVPVRAANYRSLSRRRSEIEWVDGDLRDSEYCTRLVSGMNHVFISPLTVATSTSTGSTAPMCLPATWR
jgi:uncharacterized protein YbjT (DUF2867 family)